MEKNHELLRKQAVIIVLAIYYGASTALDKYGYFTFWEMLQSRIVQAGNQSRDLLKFIQNLSQWLWVDLHKSNNPDLTEIMMTNDIELLDYFREYPEVICYFAQTKIKQLSAEKKAKKESESNE